VRPPKLIEALDDDQAIEARRAAWWMVTLWRFGISRGFCSVWS